MQLGAESGQPFLACQAVPITSKHVRACLQGPEATSAARRHAGSHVQGGPSTSQEPGTSQPASQRWLEAPEHSAVATASSEDVQGVVLSHLRDTVRRQPGRRHVLLTGLPGIGKATLAHAVAAQLQTGGSSTRVVNLRDCRTAEDLRQRLSACLGTYAVGGHSLQRGHMRITHSPQC